MCFTASTDVEMADACRELGLDPSSVLDKQAIDHAWRRKALDLHPDKCGEREAFQKAEAAYRKLVALKKHHAKKQQRKEEMSERFPGTKDLQAYLERQARELPEIQHDEAARGESLVEVHGLVQAAHLNGSRGTVAGAKSGRWIVQIGERRINVKPENLLVLTPGPRSVDTADPSKVPAAEAAGLVREVARVGNEADQTQFVGTGIEVSGRPAPDSEKLECDPSTGPNVWAQEAGSTTCSAT